MTATQALDRIQFVKERRPDDYIQEVLIKIEDYVKARETYSHQDTMTFIQNQMSGKLGGKYMYINRALEFLKLELKMEQRKSK